MGRTTIPERIFTVIAGIATLANLVLSLDTWLPLPVEPIAESSMVSKTALVLFLETAKGYGFGYLVKLALDKRFEPGVHAIVGALFIATVSAWVTFFNVVSILFGGTVSTTVAFIVVGLLAALAYLWGTFVSGMHAVNTNGRELSIFVAATQLPPFILLYIAYIVQLG